MNDDIFDRVRALHRPQDDSSWATTDEGRAVMARAINSGSATPLTKTKQRPQRRLVIGAAAVALVAGTTAAATISAITGDDPTQAGCYETLRADADTTEASAALVEQVGSVEACRQTWLELGTDIDTGNLVSCINPAGGRGVFPAPAELDAAAACGRIGWQPDAEGN